MGHGYVLGAAFFSVLRPLTCQGPFLNCVLDHGQNEQCIFSRNFLLFGQQIEINDGMICSAKYSASEFDFEAEYQAYAALSH
jgi:hypothetical protein